MSAVSRQKTAKATPGKAVASAANDAARTLDETFPIVGIGASAGGLEAFLQLVKALPESTGMGFVLIQHLDPKHESRLVELVAKVTGLPVDLATEGMKVAPNHIYAIPPNTNMAIERGRLHVTPRADTRGQHLPVDYFFRSLANDRKSRAIGVVLSGTGTDGTHGLAEIKAAGGLTFAQNADSAKYDGMPKSAAHGGAVDAILAPADIARELGRIGRHPYLAPAKSGAATEPGSPDGEPFGKILRLLRTACGVDFSQYRKSTIERRIMRRMVLHPQDSLAEYARQLEGDRAELEALFEDILINVTSFFRDPGMFQALTEEVFPEILQSKTPGSAIRIWTAGCSTGQEAYSLAIALTEFLEDKVNVPEIQIFATDLSDASSLVKARAGHYPESIEAEVSAERLRRFFRKEEGGYRVIKSIRDLCVFAKQNVAADPPFSRLDLISCRNVMIYLSRPLQKRIMPTFHYALNPGGFLLLGSSEAIGGFSELFTPINKQHKIYLKTATVQRVYPHFSADRYVPRASAERDDNDSSPTLGDWQKEADRVVVGRYAPVGVLVNSRLEVIQFRGRTSPYLEPASGEASFNLLRMAREGLFGELRHGIEEARERNETVRRSGVRIRTDGRTRLVELSIIPVRIQGSTESCFLVLFEESRPADGGVEESRGASGTAPRSLSVFRRVLDRLRGGANAVDSGAGAVPANDIQGPVTREIEQLQRELTATREHQQSILEQHEAANEELRSANEEVLSSNEELQSTNEELETAKEELQSLNEELTTVNEQLQNRNQELNGLNNDLSNFFGSTRIPILMLGNDLRLRRFTPAAEKVFNLHSADVGRPLGDIRLSVDVPELEAAVLEVLDTMQHREAEVRDRKGRWHALRIRPYRTADNKIEGAVVALVDIDHIKRSEESLREAAAYAEAIIATVREPLVVLDPDLRVRTANLSFYQAFNVKPEETERRLLYELGDHQWDVPGLRALLEEVLSRDTSVEDYPVEHDFPGIGRKTMLVNARQLRELGGSAHMLLVAFEDITERHRLEQERTALLAREHAANEELQKSEVRYRHLVEALPAAVYTCDGEGRITLFNEAAAALWGRTPEIGEDQWCGSWRLYRPDGSQLPLDEYPMSVAIKEGRAVRGEIAIERPDGFRADVIAHATPLFDASGSVAGATNLLMDITEQKRNEDALARLAAIVEFSDDAIISKDLDGKIRSWNLGAERMFGYSAGEAVGRSIMFIVPPDREEEEVGILAALRRGERIVHFETVRTAKDGRHLDVSVTISPLRNADGAVIGASKIARDITEKKQHARALREADRHKDEFLAMLAHELRNPLSAVTSAVELLGMPDGMEHLQVARRIIGRQTKHLVHLVDDLLDMSRITRGVVSLHLTALDLGIVIDEAVETVMPIMEAKRHELEVSVGDEPLWLEGDSMRLEQALANLLTNAAKYTEPGGHIRLGAERQDDMIVISVQDNGMGISSDLLPSVFELFSQSERTSDRSSGGLGIGLTLVHSIVGMHGGTVDANSGGLNQGSEFIVRLPALEDSEIQDFGVPPSSTATIVDPAPARRVLLVDDNQDAALGLSQLLEAFGHSVEQSFDGLTALDAAAASRPEAILLDIGLPGMDGYEVARRIRQNPELTHVLLIAISGYCQDEDRERSREAGFDYHLAKPVDHRHILTLLEEHPPTDEPS